MKKRTQNSLCFDMFSRNKFFSTSTRNYLLHFSEMTTSHKSLYRTEYDSIHNFIYEGSMIIRARFPL